MTEVKFNSTFEKSDFFCIFLLKIWIFFWNEIFLKCCVCVEFEFSSTSVFSTNCFVIRFFFRYELFDQILSFFFCHSKMLFEKSRYSNFFFRSIWKCDVINQKRIFDDIVTSYLTDEDQTRTRSVIKFEEWCWMNIIFTWWKMIQSENSSSFRKHIKIFISFAFFFDKFFSINDFWQFKSLNLIKQFQLFSKYQDKQLFKLFFAMFDFSVFQQSQQNVMTTILRNFNWARLLLLFSMQKRGAIFEILKKLKKAVEKKSIFLKIFVNFILNDTEAFVDYDLKKLFVERFFLIWKVYDAKTQKNYRHHMNMHKIENVWNEKKRDMFLNHSDEILRYAAKMTRSERNFRKVMTAVKKIKNYWFAHSKKEISINKSIMIRDWKILYQHVDEKEITENTRIKKMKKSFYKFSIRSIQNTSQQQTKSQSEQKFKISKTSIWTRRTRKTKAAQTNEIDFFSNDDANDSMIVNSDFFVDQYSEQFVTFSARNTSVGSELNSHKLRQNFLFSFFLMNQTFTSFFEYVQWKRQNASAILRENKKKIQKLRQKKCDFDWFRNIR